MTPPAARQATLVEQIDLAPTFVEMAGGTPPMHIPEGRSLVPLLAGERPAGWRDYVISEYDYAVTPMAGRLAWRAAMRGCSWCMTAATR